MYIGECRLREVRLGFNYSILQGLRMMNEDIVSGICLDVVGICAFVVLSLG